MSSFTFDTSIERGDEEILVRVTYARTVPYVAATLTQPAEGPEVEILAMESKWLMPPMSDDEEAKILEECQGRLMQDLVDEADERADYEYESRRDRMMEDRS